MDEQKKLIGSFEKSWLEEIRASLSTFKDRRYFDLRVFTKRAGLEGEETPTHKGLTIRADLIGELRRLIDRALAEFELERKVSGEIDEQGSKEPGEGENE